MAWRWTLLVRCGTLVSVLTHILFHVPSCTPRAPSMPRFFLVIDRFRPFRVHPLIGPCRRCSPRLVRRRAQFFGDNKPPVPGPCPEPTASRWVFDAKTGAMVILTWFPDDKVAVTSTQCTRYGEWSYDLNFFYGVTEGTLPVHVRFWAARVGDRPSVRRRGHPGGCVLYDLAVPFTLSVHTDCLHRCVCLAGCLLGHGCFFSCCCPWVCCCRSVP